MNLQRYGRGSFAPVNEEVTAFDLPVTGSIPGDLNGRYLRIGPNSMGVEDVSAHIWTMGEGMVHGVRLRDGRAEWYRNRWIRSSSVADRLGEPRRGRPVDERTDIAPNVQVAGHGGRIFALSEGGIAPYELTPDLDTVGICDLGASGNGFAANAHSKFDPRTGEMHSLAFVFGVPYVQHIVFEPGGAAKRTTDIPAPNFPYMHDFALTDHYVLLYASPLVFDPSEFRNGLPLRWNSDMPTQLGVLPRAGGAVRWMDLPVGMVGHTLNAYETESGLVIDVTVHPDGFEVRDIGASKPVLERWHVDLAEGRVRTELLHDRPQDFPRLNARYSGQAYRFGYSASTALYAPVSADEPDRPDVGFSNAILKHDLVSGSTEAHEFGRDAAAGEAVFVPTSSSGSEDDGYVLLYVHEPERGAADLVILAGQDFRGEPLARIHLPVRVPLGLHGNWIPDA
jgi:carotenoid cleavage dioxygenase-like enzyme